MTPEEIDRLCEQLKDKLTNPPRVTTPVNVYTRLVGTADWTNQGDVTFFEAARMEAEDALHDPEYPDLYVEAFESNTPDAVHRMKVTRRVVFDVKSDTCRHGDKPDDCPDCHPPPPPAEECPHGYGEDVAADIAFDAARERQVFGR